MQSLSWPGALAYRGFRRLALALGVMLDTGERR